jgi:acyl-CoA dehydrogenase
MTRFRVAEEPEEFRRDLVAWLEVNAPRSLWESVTTPFQGHWGGRNTDFESVDHRTWFERCLAHGWTAPGWPIEYGGAGLSRTHTRVFRQELRRRGLPFPLVGFGLTMIGPILLSVGTPEQKAEHLPPIVRGEIRWCQGYSEPGAGSDLANLRTRADLDGEHFVVSGQKVWTSHADRSDWIFCLVRTRSEGKKQGGITFLLIDMTSPGIRVQPIQLISGASPFCEVFFDEVRVPKSQMLGTLHDGWRVAKALLAHERSMVGESVAAGGARPPILHAYSLADHALDVLGMGPDGRLSDPLLRDQITRSEMDQEAMRQLVHQVNEVLEAGGNPGAESSILKVVGTELNQRRWELAMEIAGPTGLGWEGDEYSEWETTLSRQWLRSRGNSIEGGTSEIQRNIMARRVLGLPKGK